MTRRQKRMFKLLIQKAMGAFVLLLAYLLYTSEMRYVDPDLTGLIAMIPFGVILLVSPKVVITI